METIYPGDKPKEAWDYSLHIRGLWGRNRKVKLESFTLVDSSLTEKSQEELADLLARICRDINYKSGAMWIVRYPVELVGTWQEGNERKIILITRGFTVWSSGGTDEHILMKVGK